MAIRDRIDHVDRQIQELINERARYAQEVGVSKGELASAVDYYRPEREAEVLRAVVERNEGPLRDRSDPGHHGSFQRQENRTSGNPP